MLALLLAGILSLGAKAPATAPPEADVRKADYYYLEGLRQQSLGNYDSYFTLTQRALELNPDDEFLGMEHGKNMLRLSRDSASIADSYTLMKRYVDDNPLDFYNNLLVASLALSLDREEEGLELWQRLHYYNRERPEVTAKYAEVLAQTLDSANMAKAIELYDSLEVSEGPSINLSTQKIRIYYQRDDSTAILNEASRLLTKGPNIVDFNVFAADMYSQFGDPDSALVLYNRALEIDPSDGVAYYSLANFYHAQGDSVAYDREVFKALQQESLELSPKLEIFKDYIGALYGDSLQWPRINNLFQVLVDQYPHEEEVHILYRDYLIAVDDYAGAAEQASYALDINPADEQQWVALSSLWLTVEDYQKSIDAARRGSHYYPDNTTLYLIGSAALTHQKEYAEALEMLKKAKEIADPRDYKVLSDLCSAMGDTYYAKGERDSAYACYNEAIELYPDNFSALNNCAYYLACDDRDLDRALEMIEKVVAFKPEDPTSLDTYAWVLFKRKDYVRAKEIMDKTLENSDEPSSELYDHAGDIYFMLREPGQALEFWKKALELDPDNELIQRKVTHKTYFYE
ncbi:MAG: tetratricopeptide repeat protein [Bacteroidales bacterium]|nr:tetratricopeptide repeat protein [Bacteroidales bacterium]